MSRTKKLILVIAAVLVLNGTLIVACALHNFVLPVSQILTSSSPAGTYTVTLTGQAKRPLYPAVLHTVRFSVLKNGKAFIEQKYLHSGDWLDPSFAILYPKHEWPSENILHFYNDDYFKRGKPSVVNLENNSGKAIKFLQVTLDDAYLVFDLQPGSAITLNISPPRGSMTYISVEGEFLENIMLEKKGQNFRVNKSIDKQINYHINIIGTVPLIDSPDLEKYRSH